MAGKFFNLGIQFLLNPSYLFFLFPERLYCYFQNKPNNEMIFRNLFLMSHNNVYGPIYLIIWFTMAFFLLVLAILIVQAILFQNSATYRFKRRKQLFPSKDAKLLRKWAEKDYVFCKSFELIEFFSDPQDFKKFLDYLAKKNYLESHRSLIKKTFILTIFFYEIKKQLKYAASLMGCLNLERFSC